MELMKKIILSACFLSVIITIADSIKPGEKFTQQLKMIFSLVDIPAFADLEYSEDYNNVENAADNILKEETESKIDAYIEDILLENEVTFDKISSDVNIDENNSININRIDYKGTEFEQARNIIIENFGDVEVKKIE